MDHQQAAVLGSAADDTYMGIIRVKYQITGLCVRPRNIGTIGVLHGGSAAVADDVAAACGIVKNPIDKSTAIQAVGPIGAGGGAACRRDLPQLAPAGIPAEDKTLDSDR